MHEKTQFEEDYGIDLSSPNLDISKAVEVAIEIEKMGKQFYEHHAEKADSETKRFLDFLAREEEKHINILENLRKSLQERNAWTEVKQDGKIEEMISRIDTFRKNQKAGQSSVSAIIDSIEREKETRNFYLRLAENLKNEEGRRFFRSLAEWEQSHYELLSGILEAETEFRMES